MEKRGSIKRIFIQRLLAAVSLFAALFVLVLNLFTKTPEVYGLSISVTTQEELEEALASSEYDEIILANSITLTDGTTLDGDQDDDGERKVIRASVTGTTDQGVVNSDASTYTLFYVAANATVHINNCIIKGGGYSAIVNGSSTNSTTNNSTLYVDNCQISNSGSSSIYGGGIRNATGCTVVLTNSSILRNVATYGAGFQNQQGTFIMDNCSVSENRSLQYGGGGGENTGNGGSGTNAYMYIYNSTIANNTSQEIGGGINNCKNGYLYVINSTVAGNATTNGTYSGGGIGNNDSTLVCTNSILLDNVYLSSDSAESQDAYAYSSGSVTLEGCVYGTVSGTTSDLVAEVDVESSCYQVTDSDTVFAATKTGSIINTDGSQGTATYNQVALVTDENGVTYAPLSADSAAIVGNSSLTTVKVEFDYSDLSNITCNTGEACSESTVAPTTIGGGEALSQTEKIVTVTVFVNSEFEISGGTVFGDSYIVDTSEASDITLTATAVNSNESVVWALVDEDSNRLSIVSGNNPYTIDTSETSEIMTSSWDTEKNAYDIVLQPITVSLTATAGNESVTLGLETDWSATFCSSYTLANSLSSYEIYYGLVNDFSASATSYFGSLSGSGSSIEVTGLMNGSAYYFFAVPKYGDETITGELAGYVSATPEESGEKTYVLTDSIEDGEEYLIVSKAKAGSGNALTTGSTAGSYTSVTIQTTTDGTAYIKTEASDDILWTATVYNTNYYRIQSGNYYIALSGNNRPLNTTAANLTVTFSDYAATITTGTWRTYYLNLSGASPTRSTSTSYVYFYKLKTAADSPTGITTSMQSEIGVDSGTISGLATTMEYSTDGLNWSTCTSTTMNNVAVGKYYFRYAETETAYASPAVTVEVLEKQITAINVKTNPTLTYTALDSLDLSSLVVTIVYNDDTTTDVAYSDFASTDSSVYQRSSGVITTSMENGVTLACSDNGSKIMITLDEHQTTTLALTVDHKLTSVAAKAATCEEDGNLAYYVCDSCGKIFDSDQNETTLEAVTIDALGHDYGTPTYTWSSDNSTCTAVCTCQNDSSHQITETVTATSEVTTAATCEATGVMTYTATFTNTTYFQTQTTTSTIDALGHDYDYENGAWTWHNNYYVTVVFTCKNDSSHTVSYTATMSNAITKEATCEEVGIRTYTATVTIDGVDYTDTNTEEIAAIGHNYSYPTYTWSSDKSTCTAVCTCQNDSSHQITETVNSTSEVTTEPTCTNTGVRTYTATFTNTTYFQTQTTTATIDALGHNYDYTNGVWNWDSVYYVTYTVSCTNDSSHTTVYQATITNEITTEPTCTETGIRTYTATVTINEVTYTDTYEEVVAATGHNYGASTYTWSADYSTCTAVCTCQNDSSHQITETVNSVSEIYKEATCEDTGTGLFTATFTNTTYFYEQKIYTEIPALGHDYEITYTWSSDNSTVTATATCTRCSDVVTEEVSTTNEVTTEPTCTTTGIRTYTATFTNTLFAEQTKDITLDALGHSYGDVTYTWNEDNSKVTASRTCATCGNVESEEVTTTSVTVDATCEVAGSVTYTGTFTNTAFETQVKVVEIAATGHDYDYANGTWFWTGYESATYTVTCQNNASHTYTYTATITSAVTTAATCTTTGVRTYTATVIIDSTAYTSTKTEKISALGHTAQAAVEENRVEATCTEDGSYDSVIYCTVCGEELSRTTITIPATGHSYGNVTYTWNSDNSKVTASRTCATCGNVESEEVSTTSVTVDATCTATGSITYTATFTNEVFETQTKVVELAALGHTAQAAVEENRVEATCEASGSYDSVVYCTVCGEELSRETITIPALGHDYDYANGSWSWTGYTQATYTVTCQNDSTHTSAYTATITNAITIAATCEVAGVRTYTATVTIDSVTYTNTKTEEIAALGHNYSVSYTWSSDKSTVTATATCTRCGDVISEEVSTTNEITTAPTCETTGIRTYTATFTNSLFETQTKEATVSATGHSYVSVVTKPTCTEQGYTTHTCSNCGESYVDNYTSALGHNYEVSYTWNSDNSKVTATATCTRCGDVISEEVSTTNEITTTPTCEATGIRTYTATFTNSLFEAQTKTETVEALGHTTGTKVIENEISATCEATGSYDEVYYCTVCGEELSRTTIEIPALGHDYDYDNGTWAWNDYESATYTVTCNNDSSHTLVYNATITSVVTSTSTHTVSGTKEYIATVTINEVTYTDTVVETLPMLHHYTSETIAAKAATCEEDGNILYYYCVECGRYFTDIEMTNEITLADTVIPALGHTYGELIAEVSAGCESDGMEAHYYCSVCGTYFDEDKNETTKEALTIQALGHDYVSVITDPTCTEEGYTTHTCTRCGDSYVDTYVSALGHSYSITYTWNSDNSKVTATATCTTCGDIVTETVTSTSKVTTKATCEATGVRTYTATFTNSLFEAQSKTTTIDALGHTEGAAVVENRVDATCETAGHHDEVIYCTVCGEELSRTTITDSALGHDLVYHEGKEATCTEAGYEAYYTCSRCDYTTYTEIPALGHDYDIENGTWTWTGYEDAIYTVTCKHDSAHTYSFTASITNAVTTEPTCTTTGIRTYIATVTINSVTYTDTKTEEISALGHITGTKVIENEIAATCTATGSYDEVYYCTVCGEELSRITIETPALGHTEGTAVEENRIEATCEADGSYDSVIYCTVCGEELSRTTITIPATGHDYDNENGTWSWTGYESATYTITCQNDSTHTYAYTATITSEVTTEATCTATGIRTYTATVTIDSTSYTNKKTESISALGHTAATAIIENEIAATCTEAGSYDSVIYCSVCGEELSRTTIEVPATGHSYGEVTYTWNTDNSTVTASRTCELCGTTETEEVSTTSVTVDATCESTGSTTYTATFTNTAFTKQVRVVEIEALGHDYDYANGTWSWTGYTQATYTVTCNNDASHTEVYDATITSEITTEPTCIATGVRTYTATIAINEVTYTTTRAEEIAALGHTEGTAVEENRVEATCEVDGSYDSVVYCTVCGAEISRETIVIPATGHDYDNENGIWSWTLYESATYTVTCKNDSTHTYAYTATITSEVTTEATCTATGIRTYTATVTINSVTYTNTKTEEIDALGHTYGDVTYTWNGDNSKVTASYTCATCGNVESEEVFTTSVTVDPTCEDEGSITYTATFTNEAFTTQNKVVSISAIGHNYDYANGTWTWNGYTEATYIVSCTNDASHTLSYTATITSSVTTEATCTVTGIRTYTATVTINEVTYTTTKEEELEALGHNPGSIKIENRIDPTCETAGSYEYVICCTVCGEEISRTTKAIPALGHDYDNENGTWAWNGYTEATYTVTCQNDSTHTYTYEATITSVVISNSSCTEAGIRRYTATVTIDSVTYTNTLNQALDIVGHTEGTAVEENRIEATCEADGSYDSVVYCTVCGAEISRETIVIPATGHDYDNENGTWSWTLYDSATYTVTCKDDSTHTYAYTATITNEVTTAATCTTTGVRTYTATVTINSITYIDTATEEIAALGHTYGEVAYIWSSDNTTVTASRVCATCAAIESEEVSTTSVTVDATCEDAGSITYTATFTSSTFETQVKVVEIQALGHDYDYANGTWSWNGYESATYTVACTNDASHIEVYTATITNEITVEPTCLTIGTRTYTAAVEILGVIYTSTQNETLNALGHSYGEATYTWSTDNTTVTGCIVCERDSSHKVTETVYASITITKAPTCEEEGIRTYTATFTNSLFEDQMKQASIPALGHDYDYENGIWSWTDYEEATYTVTCENDASHTYAYTSTITSEITTQATCETTGIRTYTATVTIDSVTYTNTKTEEIAIVEHTSGSAVVENEVSATCTEKGSYDEVIYCTVCGEELSRTTVETEALGHTSGSKVIENEVSATCTEKGSYDEVIYCTVCGDEISRTTIETSALGHNYSVSYTWSSDKSTVTATATCTRCGDVISEEVSTTNEITTTPTCETTGIRTYTATFTNSLFETQTKEATVSATGHSYVSVVTKPTCTEQGYTTHTCSNCGESYVDNYTSALGHNYEVSYTWNSDNSKVTATATCTRCGDVISEEVSTANEITTTPTCEATGIRTYTATFTNSLFEAQTKTETVEALGHTTGTKVIENEISATCEATGSYDEVYYCTVCGEELSRTTIEIPALGHDYDYDNGTWAWNDYESATYTVTCNNDSSHTLVYNATITSVVTSTSTHTVSGTKEYIATVTINEVTYTDIVVETLPMLHHDTSVTVSAKAATCEEDGNILYYYCVECGKYFSNAEMTNEITLADTVISALGHTYGELIAEVSAGCESDGMEAHYYCSVCGTYFDEDKNETTKEALTIQALGHDYVSVITNPTCTEEGYTTHTCTRCGDSYVDTYVSALGHSYSITYTWNLDNSEVTATATCTTCGDIITETVTSTSKVTTKATCEATGVRTYTATFTNSLFEAQSKTTTIDALGHTEGAAVVENRVDATCETAGHHDEVIYCTVCGEGLSRTTITDSALGHDLVYHEGKEATCTEAGYEAYYTCSRCDYTTYTEIPALGHTAGTKVIENEISATCEHAGSYDEVIYCAVCGEELSRTTIVVEVIAHTYGDVTYTWSNDNQTVTATMICQVCGNEVSETVGAIITIKEEATCTSVGVKVLTATFLNSNFEEQTKEIEIEALNHSYEYIEEASASCEASGMEAHYYCEACGTYFDLDKNETTADALTISALGHDYVSVVTDPTCTEEGYTTHTCTRCGDSYTDTHVSALGHNYTITYTWNNDNTVVTAQRICTVCGDEIHEESETTYTEVEAATCLTDGVGKYVVTFLNPLFESQTMTIVLEALGHSYGALIEQVDSTCEQTGLEAHYVCSRCGKYFTENMEETTLEALTIPALGHTAGTKVIENEVSATCTTTGSYDEVIYCTVCGEELSRTTITVPKLDHTYQSTVTSPTCTEEGYTTHTCTLCGDTYVDTYVDALGHDYTNATYKWNEDYCKVTAKATCSLCGEVYTITVSTTSNLLKDATCEASGAIRYTAVFDEDYFETQQRTVTIEALGHTPLALVTENWVDATCEAAGSYDEVIYCKVCGEELSRTTIEIPALGHDYDYDNGTWAWNNYESATYTVICQNDASHSVSYTATITSTITKEATYTATGIRTYTATVIIDTISYETEKEETIPALSHTITIVYGNDATCETSGNITYYYCTDCGKYYSDAELTNEITYQDTILEALGHDYGTFVEAQDPTCEEDGHAAYYHCSRCGKYFTDEKIETTYAALVLSKLGHNYVSVVTDPTCTTKGYTTHTCTNCGDSYIDSYTNALGHSYGEVSYIWSNDHTSITATIICSACGDTISEEGVVTVKVSKKATCETTGIRTFTATFTSEYFEKQSLTEEIAALGHSESAAQIENSISATCLATGSHEEVIYCTVCGEELSRTTITDPALGHDFIYHEGKEATCTEAGYEAYYTCSRCDYTSYQEIPALGHTEGTKVIENVEEATCLATGSHDEVIYCTICGEELSRTTVIDPALGHDYKDVITLPTCTEQGYTTHTCSRCGRSYVDTYQNALGHDYSIITYEWSEDHTYILAKVSCTHDENHYFTEEGFITYVTVSEPTCTECGLRIYTAQFTNPKFETQVEDVILESLGHTLIHHEGLAPTCEEEGYAAYDTCSCCDYTTFKVLPATGHTEGTKVNENIELPTCLLDGCHDEVIYCEVCGEELSRETIIDSALGHTMSEIQIENGIASTCLTTGSYDEAIYCTVCGEELSRTTIITPALGHDTIYHEGKEPTCTEAGYKAYETCSRCDYTTYEEIPALGHDYIDTIVEPTCLDKGYTIHTCPTCGDTYIDTYIDALGHSYGNWMMNATPTSEEQGEAIRVCTLDSCHEETYILPVLNNEDYEYTVLVPATKEELGVGQYAITLDGDILTILVDIPKVVPISAWEVTLAPTTEEIGEAVRDLSNSSSELTVLPVLNDKDYTYTVLTEATKALDGKAKYSITIDGGLIEIEVVIPAYGYTYTYYHGEYILAKYHGYYGDTVIVPSAPSDYAVDGYIYSFYGWDKEIPSELHEDLQFNAIFVITEIVINGIMIEIPESVHIDSSYKVVIEEKEMKSAKKETSILESSQAYDGYDLTSLFDVYFERDGERVTLGGVSDIKIYMLIDQINSLEEDTKLFYFDEDGNVTEVKYSIEGNYVVFTLPTIGNIGFGNDNVTWVWTVLVFQSTGLMVLVVVVFLRKKFKAKRA